MITFACNNSRQKTRKNPVIRMETQIVGILHYYSLIKLAESGKVHKTLQFLNNKKGADLLLKFHIFTTGFGFNQYKSTESSTERLQNHIVWSIATQYRYWLGSQRMTRKHFFNMFLFANTIEKFGYLIDALNNVLHLKFYIWCKSIVLSKLYNLPNQTKLKHKNTWKSIRKSVKKKTKI